MKQISESQQENTTTKQQIASLCSESPLGAENNESHAITKCVNALK
jgi:hypothetical protein